MRPISLLFFILLPSCATMPEFYKMADDVLTDNAVVISCDRDCFKKNTDLKITLDLIHKE